MPEKRDEELGGRMSFLEHLEELRRRLLVSVGTIFFVFAIVLLIPVFNKPLIQTISDFFLAPLREAIKGKGTLQFTAPFEGFVFQLKLAGIVAVFVASPMLFYQFWKFVAPGLYRNERRYLLPFLVFSTLFFVAGAAFGYFFLFPATFGFFASFASNWIQFNPKLNEAFSFAVWALLGFGVVFEMPLISFVLARMGVLSLGFMTRNFKYAIVVIFILAAVLTPGPDVFSQCLLAFPMLALYGVSTLVVWIFGKKQKAEPEESGPEPAG
jgi:sec-independent protein translocase protein TatC